MRPQSEDAKSARPTAQTLRLEHDRSAVAYPTGELILARTMIGTLRTGVERR